MDYTEAETIHTVDDTCGCMAAQVN